MSTSRFAPLPCLAMVVAFAFAVILVCPALGQQATDLPEKPFPPGQIPPPDLPPPLDGGPIAYSYSTDEAIRFFQARVDRNPGDFVSCRILGEFHEKKAEETGELASYERAEAALRRCLAIAPDYTKAKVTLAAVLCSRHQFAEGLKMARNVLAKDPGNVDALATLGDALLETGQYPEAEAAIGELRKKTDAAPVLSRVASLMELKGDADGALRLMAEAEARARKAGGDKVAAWFVARLGDIALLAGRVDEAESYYRSVPIRTDPYHDATAALGRIRAGQGRISEAVAHYEKAVAIGPDPHMLAALGDLYLKLGREAEAKALFDRLVAIASGKNEYLRALSLFYSDHDRDLPEAVRLARLDFVDRKDVYGHDALAWALLKNGQPEEAARVMEGAFRLGTKDSNLDYHAGLIHLRLGDKARAREHLGRALARNPAFSPRADDARKLLADLDNEAGVAPK